MLSSVLHNYGFGLEYLKMLLADIPDDQMCDQPAGIVNHPAWTVGHLSMAAEFGVMLLGGEMELPAGWNGLYGRGSTPKHDRSLYGSKSELLAAFEHHHGRATAAAAAATPEMLAAETPDPDFRQVNPTLGDALVFILVTHTGAHLGQLSAWRRTKGLPGVLG